MFARSGLILRSISAFLIFASSLHICAGAFAQDPQTAAPEQAAAPEEKTEEKTNEDSAISRFSKPMPEIPTFSAASFAEKTMTYKKRPYDDDVLAYKINVPKDWELAPEKGSSNAVVSDRLFVELNKYYGPPRLEGRSRLEVSAVNMDYDFTAEQWYIKYILESGYTVEGMKVYDDTKIESLMVVMEGDFSYYLRTLAVINGKKMILIQYYLPATYWQEEAPMQASVMQSFELINKRIEKIGEYQKFQFLDVAELTFPKTWYASAPAMRSVERMSAKFHSIRSSAFDTNGKLNLQNKDLSSVSDGHVDVSIVSGSVGSSLISEVQTYKKELETSGIVVGKKLDVDPKLTFHENITFSISEVYEGIDSSSDFISYELWFSMFVAGNYYYFVTLFTPSPKQNYVAWAKNVRGYKEIVSSLLPTSGAYLER